ncbi:hypothetical protein M2150_001821 [Lachnospiraceae bacterium PM6-15]|uniref:DUF3784 domain-containing protein n=1 Tax=Ohessyouella blattaphilus TaxID=2949333 RepID=UPI003E273E87
MIKIIFTGICFLISIVSIIYCFLTNKKRGPILSNVYIMATKEEKRKLDKNKLYVECRDISFFISLIFFSIGMFAITEMNLFKYVAYFFILGVIVYAVVISAKSLK